MELKAILFLTFLLYCIAASAQFNGNDISFQPILSARATANKAAFLPAVTDRVSSHQASTQLTCNNWLSIPSSPGYVAIGDLDISGDQLTVEATFNRTTTYSGGVFYAGDLVSKHNGPENVNYLLRPNTAEITTSNGYYAIQAPCEIELNKTYHVALVYDGKTLSFYRNGFLMGRVAASGNLYQNDFTTQIGYYADLLLPENFIGYINEVRIWNVARTQAEIKAYIDIPLPLPQTQAGLKAYYTFDNLTNKQGDARWNGKLGGSASINKTNPTCAAFKLDSCCVSPNGRLTGTTICPGQTGSLIFTSTVGTGPFKITYSDGSRSFTQNGVMSNVAFPLAASPTVSTTYTITSIEDANGCSGSGQNGITATVSVYKLPDVSLLGSNICLGDSGTFFFKATQGVSPFTLVYTDGTNNFTRLIQSTNEVFTHPEIIRSSTTFQIASVVDGNGCITRPPSAGMTGLINIHSVPQGQLIANPVCIDDSIRVTLKTSDGTPPFLVTLSDGNQDFSMLARNLITELTLPATLNSSTKNITLVSIKQEASPGCMRTNGFTISSVNVNGLPTPVLEFPAVDPVCLDAPTVYFSEARETTGISGKGTFSGAGVIQPAAFQPSAAGAGDHNIAYTFTSDAGCKVTSIQRIKVNPLPLANAGEDQVICGNTPVRLHATGGQTYAWSPAAGLSNPNIPDPVATTTATTDYTVTVTDAAGCVNTDQVKVTTSLVAIEKFHMANVFTPNGDGRNDCFGLGKLLPTKVNEFSIFNRWGQKVFSSKNTNSCWDGSFKGLPQPAGAYVYILNVVTNCGALDVRGTVFLAR